MRAMPSPKGTNLERRYLPEGPVVLAMDAKPRVARDLAPYNNVAEAIAKDLEGLQDKISPTLFEDVKVALGEYYQANFLSDLEKVDERIDDLDVQGMDRLPRDLRRRVSEAMVRKEAKDRQFTARLFPDLARIRVQS